jgi:hypothetical protein
MQWLQKSASAGYAPAAKAIGYLNQGRRVTVTRALALLLLANAPEPSPEAAKEAERKSLERRQGAMLAGWYRH